MPKTLAMSRYISIRAREAPRSEIGRARRARALGFGATTVFGLTLAAGVAPAAEFRIHGMLDVVAAERGLAYDTNVLTRGDSPFDAYGLRLSVDSQVNERLQVFSQVVLRDATMPYVDGAYLSFMPTTTRDLHLLAGKVPWPIGTYAPRTYSNRNPLVGAPLMYQYHTTLLWYEIVPSADALLATSGSGQYGANYFGYPEGRGMPLVDDSYWDVGVTLVGSERPLEYALGTTAGTPGWGSTSQDENTGKSVLGRVALAPLPGVRFGISGAYGPYLVQALDAGLPPGKGVNDFHQKLGMADLELLAGHVEFRAEGASNIWQTPTVGDLKASSGYLELKYAFPVGAYLAGRWDALRFGDIADSTGVERPWDSDVTRFEVGVGYRFSRDALGKLIFQQTELYTQGAAEERRRPSLVAAQLVVTF
ncbi:MAG TPA: hypothetical protein VGK93_09875 [Candidatus Eisenbacteria bacterium]